MLAALAERHRLPRTGWVLASTGAAAVTWLHDELVVKVHPPAVDFEGLARQLRVCDVARAHGVPFCAGGISTSAGPFDVDGTTVTVWSRVDPTPAAPEALGRALSTLHRNVPARCEADTLALGSVRHARAVDRWNPFWDRLTPHEAGVVRPWVTWASDASAALVDGTVVHGDVHPDNALGGDNVVLIDLDTVGVGWAAGDVAQARRHMDARTWDRFVDGYGTVPDPDELAVSERILRISNFLLFDVRQRHKHGPASPAARHVTEHLALLSRTSPPRLP